MEELAEHAVQGTSNLYNRGKGRAFKKARESTLDSLGLKPYSSNRSAVCSVASQNLSFRGHAVKRKKARIEKFNKLHGNLFPSPSPQR